MALIILISFPSIAQRSLVPLHYSEAYKDPPYMVLEADSITAVLEHVYSEEKFVVFDVEVVNRSGQRIQFNPYQMHYYASPKPFQKLVDEDQDIHRASFPNSTVPGYLKKPLSKESVERAYEQQLKQQRALAIAFGIISLGAVVADVALDINDSKKPRVTERDFVKSANRDVLVATTLIAGEMVMENAAFQSRVATEELHYLQEEVLEPVELADDSAVRGKVYFQNTGNYKYYRIVLPVGEINYVFDFRKRRSSEY